MIFYGALLFLWCLNSYGALEVMVLAVLSNKYMTLYYIAN